MPDSTIVVGIRYGAWLYASDETLGMLDSIPFTVS
jgi:hypothetical protein